MLPVRSFHSGQSRPAAAFRAGDDSMIVIAQADRLKVNRLKEKTYAIIIALQSSA
jgi:hypothetical protein